MLHKSAALWPLLLLCLISVPGCKTDPNQQLLKALKNQDVEAIYDALGRGANLHTKGELSAGVLTFAVVRDASRVTGLLIQSGADVNQPANRGYTPLMCAAFLGKGEMVKFLHQNGAKLDLKDADGDTAVVWALLGGNRTTADSLVEAGADPASREEYFQKYGQYSLQKIEKLTTMTALLETTGWKRKDE